MEMLDRRTAFKMAAATGAAVVAVGTAIAADDKDPPGATNGEKAKALKIYSDTVKVTVWAARSWDHNVYLSMGSEVKGWVDLGSNAFAFAIAAAAEAAKRPIYVKYWGYDPNWGSGAGHFDGVHVSLDDITPP